jgi:hypothetical protein
MGVRACERAGLLSCRTQIRRLILAGTGPRFFPEESYKGADAMAPGTCVALASSSG